jgi:hypothetical protein
MKEQTLMKKPFSAAKIVLITSITYLCILVLLHIIKPEVSPSWQTLSIYARGEWGWLGQVAYCVLGLTHIALFAAMRTQVKSRYGKVGLAILLIAGVGGILGGLGVSDPLNTIPSQASASGQLHAIGAALEIWGAPIAALLINLNLLRKNPEWRSAHTTLIWVTILPLAGLILFMGSGAAAGTEIGPGDVIGYMNRVAIVAYIIWQIILARFVINLSKERKL